MNLEFEIPCQRCGLINHDKIPLVKVATWLECRDCGYNLIKFFDNPNGKEDYRFGENRTSKDQTVKT